MILGVCLPVCLFVREIFLEGWRSAKEHSIRFWEFLSTVVSNWLIMALSPS